MDRNRVSHLGGADDCRHVEVTLRRWGATDTNGLVRQQNMLQIVIHSRMYGNGLNAHFPAGPQYSQGDFAAISNNDLIEHRRLVRSLGSALIDHEQNLSVLDRFTVLHAN